MAALGEARYFLGSYGDSVVPSCRIGVKVVGRGSNQWAVSEKEDEVVAGAET